MIHILTGPHAGGTAVIERQGARRYRAREFLVVRGPVGTVAPETVYPLPEALRGLALVDETHRRSAWWRLALAAVSLGFLAFLAEGTHRRRYVVRFTGERAFELATDDPAEARLLDALIGRVPARPAGPG